MSISWDQCPQASPVYYKDDSNKIEQLAFAFLFLYSLILLIKNLYNIYIIINIRREVEIRKLMTINLLILLMNIFNLALFGDGLASIFVSGGYLDLQTYYFFKYQGTYVLQILLATAWYKWAPLLALSYQYPREKSEKISLGLVIFFVLFFLSQLGWIDGVLFHQNICTVLEQYFCMTDVLILIRHLDPIELPVVMAIVTIALNDGIFIAGCYLVSKKIRALCQFKDHKSVSRMRVLAVVTFYGACFRLVNDILFYIPHAYLYDKLAKAGNAQGANFFNQMIWAVNILFTYLSTNLIPLTFLSINFSPIAPKKDGLLIHPSSSKTTDDESASIPSNNS